VAIPLGSTVDEIVELMLKPADDRRRQPLEAWEKCGMDAKDEIVEALFETVCCEAHKIMKERPTVFVGSDGYDDLIRRVAAKLAEYTDMSGEGYQGPDYPPPPASQNDGSE
jgi:hypothetical protein